MCYVVGAMRYGLDVDASGEMPLVALSEEPHMLRAPPILQIYQYGIRRATFYVLHDHVEFSASRLQSTN